MCVCVCASGEGCGGVCLNVGRLTSQQHASVSQGRCVYVCASCEGLWRGSHSVCVYVCASGEGV